MNGYCSLEKFISRPDVDPYLKDCLPKEVAKCYHEAEYVGVVKYKTRDIASIWSNRLFYTDGGESWGFITVMERAGQHFVEIADKISGPHDNIPDAMTLIEQITCEGSITERTPTEGFLYDE